MEKNVRLRILLVMEVLVERTDQDHGVTMHDILEWLAHNEISGERKSVYEDIHALQDYGLNIEFNKEDKTYRMVERQMELAELKLLVDAVHASKFITKSRTKQIIDHLTEYASAYQRQSLKREVYTEKPKSSVPSGYYGMDTLHEAMGSDRQVTFQYAGWNLEKKLELRHGGARYRVSPWLMVWENENYYLVAYDAELGKMKHFRIDKMSNVELEQERREGKDVFAKMDALTYSTSHFGMYGGEVRRVKIRFDNELIGVALDRFGKEIQIMKSDDTHFLVNVEVAVTSQFFGWIFALGAGVTILTLEVAAQMKEQLDQINKNYE